MLTFLIFRNQNSKKCYQNCYCHECSLKQLALRTSKDSSISLAIDKQLFVKKQSILQFDWLPITITCLAKKQALIHTCLFCNAFGKLHNSKERLNLVCFLLQKV